MFAVQFIQRPCSLLIIYCCCNVRPFELILAIRKWQSASDPTYLPNAVVDIYQRGYSQPVGVNMELRESLGLHELPTITNKPEMLRQFRDMLMKTPVISETTIGYLEKLAFLVAVAFNCLIIGSCLRQNRYFSRYPLGKSAD
jgi:hypothetical protein